MPNSNSQPYHKNYKKKLHKSGVKKSHATALKVVIFENSIAAHVSDADIKRASFLFNNIQRKIIKTKIARIHLN
ncbi:MAG: hypothetical protein V1747_10530 [Candidatus Omnitrophota bacterium]